ncbi:MAG: hypothetical protein Q9184_006087 [Pyrenodesmia sp. 2 TL-2023]
MPWDLQPIEEHEQETEKVQREETILQCILPSLPVGSPFCSEQVRIVICRTLNEDRLIHLTHPIPDHLANHLTGAADPHGCSLALLVWITLVYSSWHLRSQGVAEGQDATGELRWYISMKICILADMISDLKENQSSLREKINARNALWRGSTKANRVL